jgi:hypothetical protein
MIAESNFAQRRIGFPGARLGVAGYLVLVLGGCSTNSVRPPPPPPPPPAAAAATDDSTAPDSQASNPTAQTHQPHQGTGAPGRAATPPSEKANNRAINLLPLLEVVNDARLDTAAQTGSGDIGGYTRFYVVGRLPAQAPTPAEGEAMSRDCTVRRCYSNEARRAWERMLMGRELARVLSVKVDLRNPAIATTTTLASASYESNFSRGDSWTTELNGQLLLTPYFRIGNNSVARVEASINATAKGKDQVSGKLLAILQSASELVAPTSALLTSLNAPRMNQASQFVEQSLSGLFSNAVVEKSSNDFMPGNWNGDQRLVTIHAAFPMGKNQVTSPDAREIGTWEIRAAAPIVSIFSRITMCSAEKPRCDAQEREAQAGRALATLTPSEVMNFPVAENLTLRQALITDTGVLNAIDDLKKAQGAAESNLAKLLCSRLDERAQALGFNRFDAAATVWAFSQSAALETGKDAKLRDASASCPAAVLAKRLGLR